MEPRTKIDDRQFIDFLMGGKEISNVEMDHDFHESLTMSSSKNMKIIGSRFQRLVFPDCSYVNLEFIDCEIGTLDIRSNNIGKLTISGCHLKELIITNRHINHLEINQSLIDGGIRISGDQVQHVTAIESSFDCLAIAAETKPTSVNLRGSFSGAPRIRSIDGCGPIVSVKICSLSVEKVHFDRIRGISEVQIKDAEIDECYFSMNPHSHSVALEEMISKSVSEFSGAAGSYTIKGGRFKRLKIFNPSGNVAISRRENQSEDLKIEDLDLSSNRNLLALNLHDLILENVNLNNTTIPKVNIQNVEFRGTLFLQGSTLEEAAFRNMDVSNAEVRMLDTSLSGSELVNVQWPKGYQFYTFKEELVGKSVKDRLKILWSLKEVYRQMKVLSLSQQNKIDALYFQKQELNCYWRIVRIKTLKESFSSNIGNFFILGTNKVFSDFGQNIWRPLFFLFLVHSVFFTILLISYFDIYPFWYGVDTNVTWACFNGFFSTLLPTHGLTLKIGSVTTYIGGVIDFLMRTFSAYFIFYFVYSSRKYHQ